ncbi:hypothetical protein SeLEV6574_g02776 [Synchytrium endobioticum]|uniref:Uncharacterized protein n=1 Tax=Synchytrium endobioticum TaxID=286115 RepID=A0A507D6H4_9FUNG|nr:hypothetical protein SeLEV6574_g02776 [Synchytrium endobioticum]
MIPQFDRLVRRSIIVHDDVKTQLAAALKKTFKVESVMAPGEADVFIGRAAADLDIVVSGDSDLFCYKNVKTMVRPTRHRGQYVFNVLDKSLALRKMRLNADDLVVLAVVSGNDYVSNIPGKAIVTNVKIFQKIKEKGDLSKEAMLKEYFRFCQSDRTFDVANGVFFDFDEHNVKNYRASIFDCTIAGGPNNATKAISCLKMQPDESYQEYIDRSLRVGDGYEQNRFQGYMNESGEFETESQLAAAWTNVDLLHHIMSGFSKEVQDELEAEPHTEVETLKKALSTFSRVYKLVESRRRIDLEVHPDVVDPEVLHDKDASEPSIHLTPESHTNELQHVAVAVTVEGCRLALVSLHTQKI